MERVWDENHSSLIAKSSISIDPSNLEYMLETYFKNVLMIDVLLRRKIDGL